MKQRISRWFVDAITLPYSSLGLQCPIGVRAIPSEASPLPGHGPAGTMIGLVPIQASILDAVRVKY